METQWKQSGPHGEPLNRSHIAHTECVTLCLLIVTCTKHHCQDSKKTSPLNEVALFQGGNEPIECCHPLLGCHVLPWPPGLRALLLALGSAKLHVGPWRSCVHLEGLRVPSATSQSVLPCTLSCQGSRASQQARGDTPLPHLPSISALSAWRSYDSLKTASLQQSEKLFLLNLKASKKQAEKLVENAGFNYAFKKSN